jgi:hypothetical protein
MVDLFVKGKAAPPTSADSAGRPKQPWPGLTRRGVQIGLGIVWVLDGLLQMQPYMFTTNFARQIVAPTAQGQPTWVGEPINFFVNIIAAHPAALNAVFAVIQLALGVGFLFPRLVRPAIVGSVAWSAALWWFSEGFGGILGGRTSMVTGAPGAVLLYAVLALAAWPLAHRGSPTSAAQERVAGWLPAAWAVLWVGGAVLQVLPGQRGTAALIDEVGSTAGVPGWLADLHQGAADALGHGGSAPFVTLVAVMALVGLGGLGGRRWRVAAATVGAVVAIAFWVLGENVGQLFSSQATDPNTGPVIMLMAMALIGTLAADRRVIHSDAARLREEPVMAEGATEH